MDNNLVLTWAASIIAVGGAVSVLWKVINPLFKTFKRLTASLELFMKDWFGEAGDVLHPPVPGMLERMRSVEAELKHNGGSSIKDAVRRIENKLEEIDARLEDGNKRFDAIEKRID